MTVMSANYGFSQCKVTAVRLAMTHSAQKHSRSVTWCTLGNEASKKVKSHYFFNRILKNENASVFTQLLKMVYGTTATPVVEYYSVMGVGNQGYDCNTKLSEAKR